MKAVNENMDLLIVPSICKETFSLITLEALSFGVPVLVSSNVGAKDIVCKYNPDFVVISSKEALHSKLIVLLNNNAKLLVDFNEKIVTNEFEYFLDDHLQKIKQLYNNLAEQK